MSRIAMTILSMEALIVLLAVPAAINLSDVGTGAAWAAAGGVALICVVAASMVRRGRSGYVLGWVAQGLAVTSGIIVPTMFVLGAIFALLWVVLMRIGPEVEAAKAAQAAESEAAESEAMRTDATPDPSTESTHDSHGQS